MSWGAHGHGDKMDRSRTPLKFWTATTFGVAGRNFGPLHNFELPTVIADSRIFIGLSGSCDWSHGESHGPHRPMPAAILKNFHCEQPCYGFLGLLKFLCSQTLPNLVNCFLIIFSLAWHAKNFAQIKLTNGKKCIKPKQSKRDREKLQPLFKIPPWQSSH